MQVWRQAKKAIPILAVSAAVTSLLLLKTASFEEENFAEEEKSQYLRIDLEECGCQKEIFVREVRSKWEKSIKVRRNQ